MRRRAPSSTLFPYTTLFRSDDDPARVHAQGPADEFGHGDRALALAVGEDRKSTRLNSSHVENSYAVFCLKKKKRHPRDLGHLRAWRRGRGRTRVPGVEARQPREDVCFVYRCEGALRVLHSFPTRRSSDLTMTRLGFMRRDRRTSSAMVIAPWPSLLG